MLIYIVLALLVACFYWITNLNSRKRANLLLVVALVSVGLAQIKGLQMFSLLGILGVLGIMVASRFSRDKDIKKWLSANEFTPVQLDNTPALFAHLPNDRSIVYATYQGTVAHEPCFYAERYYTYRSGNTTSLVVHCTYYFTGKTSADVLEKRFVAKQENTPKPHWFKSQFGYFSLKDCAIFRPAMGGIAVCWRLPTTIAGYQERYEWIEEALAGWQRDGEMSLSA